MHFDISNPTLTDPSLAEQFPNDYAWGQSKENGTYYAWVQPIAAEVQFHPDILPVTIKLRNDVEFWIYYGITRQEILYRVKFTRKLPNRIRIFPEPYCLFWSFGESGGRSEEVLYHHKDKYITLTEWTDKNSFVAILRQQLYIHPELTTFWSR